MRAMVSSALVIVLTATVRLHADGGDARTNLRASIESTPADFASSQSAADGEASPYADTYTVAVNLFVVERDGSRPGRPDYLRGGEQARRHRAACNRGPGLFRGCVELKWRWFDSDQHRNYRASSTSVQIPHAWPSRLPAFRLVESRHESREC